MMSMADAYEQFLEQLGFEWLREDIFISEDGLTFFEWEDREGNYWVLTTAATDARLAGDHLDPDVFRTVIQQFILR